MERNEKSQSGVRADAWLRARYPQLSRRQIEEALEKGFCTLQGRPVRKGERVEDPPGLSCGRLEEHLRKVREGNPALSIPILLETERFVIVDKPAGIKSHPLSLFDEDTVTHWAFAKFAGLSALFPEALPTVVPHRLDTGTSGCLVVARDPRSYGEWRERFSEKHVAKAYQAWCWGSPAEDSFVVEGDMAHQPGDRRKMILLSAGESAPGPLLFSHSTINVLERRGSELFRAEITCATGVTHQVRVHLASRGFPLVGDKLYDKRATTRRWRPDHHQLRASRLSWGGETVEAPMSEFEAGEQP